jgi:peptidoglycan/xylan/chitin deacetylase (PgdA/CDA1 family)
MLIAANYHYIRPSFTAPYPSIFGVTPAQFETQLKTLGQLGEFVSAAQIRAAVRGETPLPDRALCVTFDDGLQEQYEYAWPVLRRLGIPAIFFVSTAGIAERRVLGVHKTHLVRAHAAPARLWQMLKQQGAEFELAVADAAARAQYQYDPLEIARLKYLLNFVLPPATRDRLIEICFAELFPAGEAAISEKLYLTPTQIREFAAHGCLGSHAHDHLPLGLLPPDEAESQLRRSLEWLETWSGQRPVALTYPYGSREASTRAVGECAARLGFEFAFTIEAAGNVQLQPAHWLARCDCNDLPGGKTPKWTAEELFNAIPAASWFQA